MSPKKPVAAVREISLAAFMKANGATLYSTKGDLFIFHTDKTVSEWRVEYSNSCCRKHDLEVLELRRIRRHTLAQGS